jgi:acetyltransferase
VDASASNENGQSWAGSADDGSAASRITGSSCPPQHGKTGLALPATATPRGLIREGRQDDAGSIREFVCALSPQSQYLRFFASVAPPSSGLLRVLCGGTGADILLVTDGSGAVVAHGMAADTAVPSGLASNIGLVVTDTRQQQGLGTLLLSTLIGRASRRGVSSLVLDVLPSNDRMLGIIGRRWPDAPQERTRDAIVITPAITPWQATGGHAVPAVISLTREHKTRQSGALRASNPAAA